jgi:hypothetical protein
MVVGWVGVGVAPGPNPPYQIEPEELNRQDAKAAKRTRRKKRMDLRILLLFPLCVLFATLASWRFNSSVFDLAPIKA